MNSTQRHQPQGWNLSQKLTAAYSVLIFLICGILTTSLYLQLRTAQRQAIKERLVEIVSLATPQIDSDYHSLVVTANDATSAYYRILNQRLAEIQQTSQAIEHIYTLRQNPDNSLGLILDYPHPPQQRTSRIGEPAQELPPLLRSGLDQINQPSVEKDLVQNKEGQLVLYGYSPIIDKLGRKEGVLVIELDAESVISSERQAQNIALLTFGLIVPLALLFGWGLARRLTSPIKALVTETKQIGKGQFGRFIQVESRDEVGQLAIAFNQMSRQLKELFDTLEAKVAERTSQLAKANQEISKLNDKLKAENIRMGAELEIAKQLQQMILPKTKELQQIPELDIAGFMKPADEIGGDYYDVLQHNGKIKIGMGDVTGHGLESGVMMIMAQTAIRTLLTVNETDPVKYLNTLNQVIYDNALRMNSDKNMTLVLLEYEAGFIRVSGQHEELIIIRSTGEVEKVDTLDLGLPIGLESDITSFIAQAEIQFNPGDIAVLYTDGITEAVNERQEFYGVDRLCNVLHQNRHLTAEDIRKAVIDDVIDFIGTQKIFDDITLLVIKQKEESKNLVNV